MHKKTIMPSRGEILLQVLVWELRTYPVEQSSQVLSVEQMSQLEMQGVHWVPLSLNPSLHFEQVWVELQLPQLGVVQAWQEPSEALKKPEAQVKHSPGPKQVAQLLGQV